MHVQTRAKLTQQQTVRKIAKETETLRRLQPVQSVIQLLDCFEDEGCCHIVTELCPGGDLQKYVGAQGPLDEARLAVVALEVLKTVKGCHDLGVLHGETYGGCMVRPLLGPARVVAPPG